MPRHFEVTGSEIRFSNQWLTLKELATRQDGEPGIYMVVERADGAIMVVQSPQGKILFEKQYRFPTGSYSWELPMGAVDAGENYEQAAARELREETGLSVKLVKVGEFHPVPGLTPQRVRVFTAQADDEQVRGTSNFDEAVDEIVERRWLTTEEIRAMMAHGEITDGFTLSALMVAAKTD